MVKSLDTGELCPGTFSFHAPESLQIKKGVKAMKGNNKRIYQMVLIAMFVALSVVGALIKIPSPTGSVALDSMPAYLAALLLGALPGAVIGFLGHLASAATGGFAMSLPIHLIVALEMALTMAVVSFVSKRIHFVVAAVVGILLNGVGLPAVFIFVPGFGPAFFAGMLLPLLIASSINVLLATAAFYLLRDNKYIRQMPGVNHGV